MFTKFLDQINRWQKGPDQRERTSTRTIQTDSGHNATDWAPDDTILGRYQVEEIMSGSMGNVYIARHLGWGIKIAIKAPRPEVLADREGMRRILTEANSWIKMGMHPNVASCFYVLTLNHIPNLFIEFVDGGNLSDWIKAGRCHNLRTALSLAIQFCNGMEFTHQRGIIHRDIKPQNILISKSGLLKITDFGIILSLGDAATGQVPALSADDPALEATIGFRGTPGYASPEQFSDTHAVDLRTDIFSFGLCLWVMLCGAKPFKNNSRSQNIPVPQPAVPELVLPEALQEVLIKSVAFRPDDRYQNFAEMRAALNAAYREAFNTDCPYLALNEIDLRADGLNNRAVSLFELGKYRDAAICLAKTLEINDLLPEALYNLILFNWRNGAPESKILRQIETAGKRGVNVPWLAELEAAVKERMAGNEASPPEKSFPEFRLCLPKNSLEAFREEQLNLTVQRSILDHLGNRRHAACHDVLMTAWKNKGYRKDPVLNQVYDRLLKVGKKKKAVGIQRYFTTKNGFGPASHVAHLPGSKKIAAAGPGGKIIIHELDSASRRSTVMAETGINITAMAVCAKGAYLAVGSEDGRVFIFSPKTGEMKLEKAFHQGPVHALSFSPDALTLISGGEDGLLKINSLANGRSVTSVASEAGAIRTICFFADPLKLATGSENGTIRFWASGGRECTRVIPGHEKSPVIGLASSPDG